MQKPVRTLVITNTMDAGGAETFLMKVYRTMNKEQNQFDFLINKQDKCFYENEISEKGGRIFRGISKSKNPIKSFIRVYRIIKDNNYKSVLCVAVHPLVAIDLLAVKLGGAKIRLVRSTNSSAGGGGISNFLANMCRPLVRCLATSYLAPSFEAGVWLFGKKAVECGKVEIITNGIQVENYEFDEKKRNSIREEFDLNGNFVIGHVGRFNRQKNHSFLLDTFKCICDENLEARLLLVGTGELETQIKEKAISLGIRDKIIFAGVRSDVPELLMAMDVLIFPSLYEGMPNVVIEAQATSLPCVISDTISKDVRITDCVSFVSLSDSSDEWANVAIAKAKKTRKNLCEEIIAKGYSIEETTKYLTECFVED